MLGLRYGSNLRRLLQYGPLVVTRQGWWDPLDRIGGRFPRAEWAEQSSRAAR